MFVPTFFLASSLLAIFPTTSFAEQPFKDEDDSLFNFVTRPEIRAPKLDVQIYDKDALSPGYWFTAPYSSNNKPWESQDKVWKTGQIGPHIYDSNGELVWSGAATFQNENAFDFRQIEYEGKKYLSMNIGWGSPNLYGAGLILDDSFNVVKDVQLGSHVDNFNQHEFNVVNDGASALFATQGSDIREAPEIGLRGKTWIRTNGFKEVNLSNSQTIFDWNALWHIRLDESNFLVPTSPVGGTGWDYVHINSVDKFANGDYLLSVRYTNCIYRISGKDGSILWRFGGKYSNFTLDGFTFSRQHHARIVDTNTTHTTVSFLNNAVGSWDGDEDATDSTSSGMFVILHHPDGESDSTDAWTAKLIKMIRRPDGDYTKLRGSVQPLNTSDPLNHNVFISWSANGYQTEFDSKGRVLAEAKFRSQRFATYRAYKYAGFVGRPQEPPVAKAKTFSVPGTTEGDLTMTVAYASWNGATEVRAWRVFGRVPEHPNDAVLLGTFVKTGFETVMTLAGRVSEIWVEALDANATVLGVSATEQVDVPQLAVTISSLFSSVDSQASDANGTSFYVNSTSSYANSTVLTDVAAIAAAEAEVEATAEASGSKTSADEGGWGYNAKKSHSIHLTAAAIAGIVIGSLALCAGLGALTVWLWLRRKKAAAESYVVVTDDELLDELVDEHELRGAHGFGLEMEPEEQEKLLDSIRTDESTGYVRSMPEVAQVMVEQRVPLIMMAGKKDGSG